MNYQFNVEVAKKLDVNQAIMINNIAFWIKKNQANEHNFYDGYTWTYNSTRAFSELFPFWSESQIKNILKKLRDNEIIKTGNYNKNTYDRTLWYTIIDKSICDIYEIVIDKNDKCIVQNQTMERTELDNLSHEIRQPIPDNKPDNKQKDNNIISNTQKSLFRAIQEAFEQVQGKLTNYGAQGKAIKQIIEKAKEQFPEAPDAFINEMMKTFYKMRKNGNEFWSSQPFTPMTLNSVGIWDRVKNELMKQEQKKDQLKEILERENDSEIIY